MFSTNVMLVCGFGCLPKFDPWNYVYIFSRYNLQYYSDAGTRGRREGSGSTEATEMILNNLFYITAKVWNHNLIDACGRV